MCCVLILLAFLSPRIVLFILWLFSNNYLSRAFETALWPLLGFLFLPATTLAYAIAQNEFGGLSGGGVIVLVIGFLIDVGLLGGGARQRRGG